MTNNYPAILEALLFAHSNGLNIEQISNALGIKKAQAKEVIQYVANKHEGSGILITQVDHMYQMCTNPLYAQFIENTIPKKSPTLSRAQIETLSIIAYRQPVSRIIIDQIRGVNSVHAVNKLIDHNLITEAGRDTSPGRPILFGTTLEFLRHFGLSKLEDLPKLTGPLS